MMLRSPPIGLVLVALLAGGWLVPAYGQKKSSRSKKRAVSIINDAYEKIKEKRAKHVETYTATLFALAESSTEDGLVEPGKSILGVIEKLYEVPRNRRKTIKAGVAVAGGGLADPREAKLERVRQKELSAEEKKKRDEVLARVAELLGQLEGKSGASADGGDPDPTKTKELESRRQNAGEKFVRDMVNLAKDCLKQNFPAHGYEVLLWVLPFEPDHSRLRKALGQYKYRKNRKSPFEWYSAYEVKKARSGFQLHPDYGWVNKAQLKNLKRGKVWFDKAKKWLPEDKVKLLRQKWENAWVHETEHFKITTNAPLRDAVLFGREIERFYRFFFRVFVDYYTAHKKPPDAKLVFGGGLKRKKKLELNYYRSRESYLAVVKADKELQQVPNIELVEVSAGFYYPGNGRSYFYRGPDGPDLTVIYHEVTHQIFGETTPGRGPRPCLWMLEGLGVFMEDPVLRGDRGSERLLAGAERPPGIRSSSAVRDINEFVQNFQTDETFHGGLRGDNYRTAGAVVHFFLFYEGGIYRKGFLRFAKEAYRNFDKNSPIHVKKLYEYLRITEETLQADWENFNKKPHLFDF